MSAQADGDGTGHAEIINMLAAAYDRFDWNDTALGGYLFALHDVDIGLLHRAVYKLVREHRGKMPVPAEVRAAALELLVGELPGEDGAYAEVQRALSTHGYHRTPDWSSPVIAAAVTACGGWSRLCRDDQQRLYFAFRGAYRAELGRAQRAALMSEGLREVAQLVADTTRLPDTPALPPPPATEETHDPRRLTEP
jgi:hypothetical protein